MESLTREMKKLSLSFKSLSITLDQKNIIQAYQEGLCGCDTNTLISEGGRILRKYGPVDEINNIDKIKLTMILHKLNSITYDTSSVINHL